jgi:hypothetical protein
MSLSRPDRGAELKFVVTNTLIVANTQRSIAFYRDVLGIPYCARESRRFCASGTFGSLSTAAAVRPTTSLKWSLRRRAIKTF